MFAPSPSPIARCIKQGASAKIAVVSKAEKKRLRELKKKQKEDLEKLRVQQNSEISKVRPRARASPRKAAPPAARLAIHNLFSCFFFCGCMRALLLLVWVPPKPSRDVAPRR